MRRLLAGAKWDADAVRDDLRAYVVEQVGDPAAILVIDETGFVKQGTKSVGVKRQSSGTAGRIAHCQIGGLLTYASPRGHVLLDRALYLPQEGANDSARRQEAGVPDDVAFATNPERARQWLERALDAGVPAAGVTSDSIYSTAATGGDGSGLNSASSRLCWRGPRTNRCGPSWTGRGRGASPMLRSSPRTRPPLTGSASRQAMARRGRVLMTGPPSAWPVSN